MHEIKIKKAANGVIITIGCQTFVEMDIDHAMNELARYLKNPDVVQAEYELKYGPFSLGTVGTRSDGGGTWSITLPGGGS